MKEQKKQQSAIVVYLDAETHKKFKWIARREGRTMTGVVRLMVERLVKTHEMRYGSVQ